MLTYTWKLTGLKRKDASDLKNIVVQTYWQKTGTDENGNTGTFIGATPFDLSTVDPNNFVSYEDLTEEIILDWIKSSIVTNSVYDLHIEEQIQKQIDEKLNPVITVNENEFPWSTGIGSTSTTVTSPLTPP